MITKKQAAWARREMDRLDGLPRQAGAVRADCMGQLLVVTDWDIAWWSDARRMLTAYLAEPIAAEPVAAEPVWAVSLPPPDADFHDADSELRETAMKLACRFVNELFSKIVLGDLRDEDES